MTLRIDFQSRQFPSAYAGMLKKSWDELLRAAITIGHPAVDRRGVPNGDRRAKLLIYQAVDGSILGRLFTAQTAYGASSDEPVSLTLALSSKSGFYNPL